MYRILISCVRADSFKQSSHTIRPWLVMITARRQSLQSDLPPVSSFIVTNALPHKKQSRSPSSNQRCSHSAQRNSRNLIARMVDRCLQAWIAFSRRRPILYRLFAVDHNPLSAAYANVATTNHGKFLELFCAAVTGSAMSYFFCVLAYLFSSAIQAAGHFYGADSHLFSPFGVIAVIVYHSLVY